jgi:putative addiction module component (TIGR02574 family)
MRAISSAGEHCLHTAGVTGSIPVSPTTLNSGFWSGMGHRVRCDLRRMLSYLRLTLVGMTVHPDVFDAALALPLDERGELISKLILSLEDEPFDDPEVVEAEWNAEFERRIADIDSGRTVGIPLDEVRRQFNL